MIVTHDDSVDSLDTHSSKEPNKIVNQTLHPFCSSAIGALMVQLSFNVQTGVVGMNFLKIAFLPFMGLMILNCGLQGTVPGAQVSNTNGQSDREQNITDIKAKYLKINDKSVLFSSWDDRKKVAKVEMQLLWENLDLKKDKISLNFNESKVQRIVSPKIPSSCELFELTGTFTPINLAYANNISFTLVGAECEGVISMLQTEKIVLEFEQFPSQLADQPLTPFVRIQLNELPGATLSKAEYAERYKDMFSYRDENQGCWSHMTPRDEMNDMAAAALSRMSLSLANTEIVRIDNYSREATNWKFPEFLWCTTEISQKSKVVFRRAGMPKECVQEIEVTKKTQYFPENRQRSDYVFGDLKLVCQRN